MGSFQVAIDGPVGVGKSTVAKTVAARTGFLYIDTGAMYRAVALHAINEGLALGDEAAVASILPEMRIELLPAVGGVQTVLLNGRDVTSGIRTPEASMGASAVAKQNAVRQALLILQREMAGERSVVMDGRDIGTRVLPCAGLKIYLTAAPEIRAMRRFTEHQDRGADVSFDDVLRDLIQRDYNDTNRLEDPLRAAPDAVVIDTGCLTADAVTDAIISLIRDRGGLPPCSTPLPKP